MALSLVTQRRSSGGSVLIRRSWPVSSVMKASWACCRARRMFRRSMTRAQTLLRSRLRLPGVLREAILSAGTGEATHRMLDTQEEARRRVGGSVGGRFQLLRLIDVGGMAAVYEASHRNGKRVAVKVLHP